MYSIYSLDKMEMLSSDYLVLAKHDGSMIWIPAMKFTVACPAVRGGYHCSWKFGSWVTDMQRLDIRLLQKDIDLSDYTPNPEWVVSDSTAVRHEKKYPCCPEMYVDITYGLNVKRRGEKEVNEKKYNQVEGNDTQ